MSICCWQFSSITDIYLPFSNISLFIISYIYLTIINYIPTFVHLSIYHLFIHPLFIHLSAYLSSSHLSSFHQFFHSSFIHPSFIYSSIIHSTLSPSIHHSFINSLSIHSPIIHSTLSPLISPSFIHTSPLFQTPFWCRYNLCLWQSSLDGQPGITLTKLNGFNLTRGSF